MEKLNPTLLAEETRTNSRTSAPAQTPHPVPAILVGGLIAGTIDALLAFHSFGPRMPQGIASGLIGRSAFQGGTATWILGLALHFFIALSMAAVYYAASRKLRFLTEYPLVCGLFYGMGLYLVMNLVVVPLSAIHARGPLNREDLIQGLLVHMFLIALPIAYSVRMFSK
jgi:Na+/alanine symporter